MIEIKRSCNSSVRQDPVKQSITFGAFTIRITEEDWKMFDIISQENELSPVETLIEIISAGLDLLYAGL